MDELSPMTPTPDQLLQQLADLLNKRMQLRSLQRTRDLCTAEACACSTELDAMLDRFHQANDDRSLSVSVDGLAD